MPDERKIGKAPEKVDVEKKNWNKLERIGTTNRTKLEKIGPQTQSQRSISTQ